MRALVLITASEKIPEFIEIVPDSQAADQLLIEQDALSLFAAEELIAAWPKEKERVLLLTAGMNDESWIRLFLSYGFLNILRGANVTKDNIAYRLKHPAGLPALDESLSCKEHRYEERPEEIAVTAKVGQVQVFWSGAGRAGVTSLAIIEALALAGAGKEVLLLDFHEPSPAICRYLSVKVPKSYVPLNLLNRLDEGNLTIEEAESYLIYDRGLLIFPGFTFDSYPYFTLVHCRRLLNLYQSRYENIVIDCAPGLVYSSTYGAMAQAAAIRAVAVPDRRLLACQQQQIEFIQKHWQLKAPISFIVNHPYQRDQEDIGRSELEIIYPRAKHIAQQTAIARKNYTAAAGSRR